MELSHLFDPRRARLRQLFGPEGVSEGFAMIGQPMPDELFLEGLRLEQELQILAGKEGEQRLDQPPLEP